MGKGKILIVIESPGKVEKLSHILGKEYVILASVGHIMDLDPKSMSVDIENNFEPTYKIMSDKIQVVDKLKETYKKAQKIIICTDLDREGEMIAWSIANVLGIKNPERATYNAITKEEVTKAVENPRKIDNFLVNAQKARRILDRIMGYELSPLLLKSLNVQHLSAGRVQSVVARLVMDREEEIKKFFESENSGFFKFTGNFLSNKIKLLSVLYNVSNKKKKIKEDNEEDDEDDIDDKDDEDNKDDVVKKGSSGKNTKKKNNNDDEKENNEETGETGMVKITKSKGAKELLKSMMTCKFTVGDIVEKESKRNPQPPFTTSTLQQEAGRKFGFTVKRTMMSAQYLYEAGLITYMRTDSVSLSDEALQNIKKYVIDKYGKEYYRFVQYKYKSKNTQEAHEAIRPTDVFTVNINEGKKIGNDEIKLYSLIWKRSVASQMSSAIINNITVHIDPSQLKDYQFISKTEVIKFPGFLTVYNIKNIEDDETGEQSVAPKKLTIGTTLIVEHITSTQEYKKPPARYNEISLVNKLDPKNLNIGRPSTYASIISKIQERGYVKKGDVDGKEKDSIIFSWDGKSKKIIEENKKIVIGKETGKLLPEELGIRVNNFLVKYFPEIMDYQFTSNMEDKLDDVANGTIKWIKVLKEFYDKFHPIIAKVLKKSKEIAAENIKVLGKYPGTDDIIQATLAKYGPVVKWCHGKKCVYAPIKSPLTLETVTLDDAIKLFEYPKNLGEYEDHDVLLNRGKFGLYITYNKIKYHVEATEDDEFTLDDAIKIIKEKKKAVLWEDNDKDNTYTILEGPYGKYIHIVAKKGKSKGTNAKLPPDTKIDDLTLDKVKTIVDEYKKHKPKFRKFKKVGGYNKVKKV